MLTSTGIAMDVVLKFGHLARKAVAPIVLLVAAVLFTGCGGGGGGSSQFAGTYRGTYNFPPSGNLSGDSGTFVLRVDNSGRATGTFNDGIAALEVETTGFVNGSGSVKLSAKFDNLAGGPATVALTGSVQGDAVSGQIHLVDNDGPQDGTFTATQTANLTAQAKQPHVASGPLQTATSKKLGLKK